MFLTQRGIGNQFQIPFVFHNLVDKKGMGIKERIKSTLLRFFDNYFWNYLLESIFYIIFQ